MRENIWSEIYIFCGRFVLVVLLISFGTFRFGVSGLSSCRNCKRYRHKLSILTQYLSADKSDLIRKCLETQEKWDKIQGVHVGFNLFFTQEAMGLSNDKIYNVKEDVIYCYK